ncbi:hypothetical protein ACFSWE_07260 [Leucobacter albus]|uniref:Uncharacterized protein n=1 Tax=Leucobacter albus TaxID=272210 RepID=A0ABW3TJB5_9MICO
MDTTAAQEPGNGALHELGLDALPETPSIAAEAHLPGRTKLTAWGLGIAGVLAFATLTLGAIAAVDWAIPYLRYLYLVLLGSGGSEF